MSAIIQALNQLLASGKYQEFFALVKGIRNGIAYGVKIRFPHSLVMTFLFKDEPLREKLKMIARATSQHAQNLAKFAFVYKLVTFSLAKMENGKRDVLHGPKKPLHVIAGAGLAGFLVFGKNDAINTQINMYLLSRVIFGFVRLLSDSGWLPSREPPPRGRDYFPLFASSVWACALFMFEFHREKLQPSLQASMTYLYDDSNHWHNVWDFLVYNKLP